MVLPPEIETLVQERIKRGSYASPDEVVVEALRLLEERDRLRELRASIIEADQQIDRGEYVEWTPDLLDRLIEEAEEMERRGETPDPDPDVWP